jgi:hypothetical protein
LRIIDAEAGASPCAKACIHGAIVFIVAAFVFSLSSKEGLSSLLFEVLKILVMVLVVGYVVFHCISGFKPTFCLSPGSRRLDDELSKRLSSEKQD